MIFIKLILLYLSVGFLAGLIVATKFSYAKLLFALKTSFLWLPCLFSNKMLKRLISEAEVEGNPASHNSHDEGGPMPNE